MRSASIARRNRRRMTHLAFGLGMFALLTTVMTADMGRSRAAGMSPGATYALSAAHKSDALGLVAAPGFDSKAAAAASLSPDSGKAFVSQGRLGTSMVLAAVISALTVLNVGFLRHLRRVYASPRRGAWRRG